MTNTHSKTAMPIKKAFVICSLFIAFACASTLFISPEFLLISPALIWYIPFSSLFIKVTLLSLSCAAKINAKGLVQISLANIALACSLSWLPLSIIFSGNVRNIFSTSSLVSEQIWLLFSIFPVGICFLLLIWQSWAQLRIKTC